MNKTITIQLKITKENPTTPNIAKMSFWKRGDILQIAVLIFTKHSLVLAIEKKLDLT